MKEVKSYIMITIGVFLVAVGLEFFLVPNDIAAGGVTGLAIVINHYIPSLSVGLLVLIMNVILFIIAFLIIGNSFGGKTIYASITLSIILWLMDQVVSKNMVLTNDLMLASIFGIGISGIGMALVFNENASTGGTDILAKILNKFFHFNMGKALLSVDFIVTLGAAVTFGLNKGLYALLSVILNGFIIDYAIDGFNICKEVVVITSCTDIVGDFIIKELDRSFTKLNGRGGYRNNEIEVIYTILNRKEYIRLKNYIIDIDCNAFIAVNDSHEVIGEGFRELGDE